MIFEFDGEGKDRKARTGLARLAAILATALVVSIGLCGVNFLAVVSFAPTMGSNWRGIIGNLLIVAGWLEIIAMGVSAGGLTVVGLIALARTLTGKPAYSDGQDKKS